MDARLIVILNDNDMSIAPPTGAMSAYLARLVSGNFYRSVREGLKRVARKLPPYWHKKAAQAEEFTRSFFTGGTMFEELGFYYVGPIDGHNIHHLMPVLRKCARRADRTDPVHVRHAEGQGLRPRRRPRTSITAFRKFNVITGEQAKSKPNAPAYTRCSASR
jgi:1-deoxy-D-xylulose-5-phosphate synthase